MSIKIRKHLWLPSLRKEWIDLQKKNKHLSPFQYYDFVFQLWKNYYPYILSRHYFPVIYTIYENGELMMIAMLNKQKGGYSLFGDVNGCEYCDFIYADNINIKRYVDVLRGYLNSSILCPMVLENSKLFQECCQLPDYSFVSEKSNVHIFLHNDYKDYFSGLSKSVRQNLRTAYNRLYKDSHTFEIKFIYNIDNITSSSYLNQDGIQAVQECDYITKELHSSEKGRLYDKMINLYVDRHSKQYKVQTSFLKQWYLKNLNFSTVSLKKLDNGFSSLLFIDGNLAAFMSGFKNQERTTLIIPRLSINGDFLFYSPGLMLVNETIKFLYNQTSIRELDLSQGTEKYKFDMGGVVHTTKWFKI